MTRNKNGFGRVALGGALLMGGSQALRFVLQILSIIVLSRILEPEDFGLIAAAAPVLVFASLVQNLGFQQAIIQAQSLNIDQINRVFWMTVAVGSFTSLTLVAASPLIAEFYGEPRIGFITASLSVAAMMNCASSLPLALLNRDLRFAPIAAVEVISASGGVVVAIGLALKGYGYWSLVSGTVTGAAIALLINWSLVRWKPNRPDFTIETEIVRFGTNVTGFNLLNFLSRNVDNILIGKLYGPQSLGFYDRAYQLLLAPIKQFNAPIGRVMIPILSKLQFENDRYRRIYLSVNWLIGLAAVPPMAVTFIYPSEVISIVFGAAWEGSETVLKWLSVAGVVQPLSNATGWIFLSRGETLKFLKWGALSSTIIVCSIIIGIPWGIAGIALIYSVVSAVVIGPLLIHYVGSIGPVTRIDLFRVYSFFSVSSVISALAISKLNIDASTLAKIIIYTLTSYCITLFLMVLFRPSRIALFWLSQIAHTKLQGQEDTINSHKSG